MKCRMTQARGTQNYCIAVGTMTASSLLQSTSSPEAPHCPSGLSTASGHNPLRAERTVPPSRVGQASEPPGQGASTTSESHQPAAFTSTPFQPTQACPQKPPLLPGRMLSLNCFITSLRAVSLSIVTELSLTAHRRSYTQG